MCLSHKVAIDIEKDLIKIPFNALVIIQPDLVQPLSQSKLSPFSRGRSHNLEPFFIRRGEKETVFQISYDASKAHLHNLDYCVAIAMALTLPLVIIKIFLIPNSPLHSLSYN